MLIVFTAAPALADDSTVRVAVTTKPVHSLVAQVMQGVAEPRLIVEGSASAHTFTLKPSTMRLISAGGMFVRVSEATEPFTAKLTASLPKDVAVLTLADAGNGVKLLAQRATGSFEAHGHGAQEHGHEQEPDDHGDDGDAAGFHLDGHVWLDPENARAILTAVARALSAKWPDHAQQFDANAAKAATELTTLKQEIAQELSAVKGKPFVVFHDAYQYFETGFGMPAAGAITLSPDHPPSAKRLTEVREKIRELRAACIFAEPGFQPKLLAAVTEGLSVRTGTLDPEGQSLPPGPGLYALLLRSLAHDLQQCLAGL